MIHIGVLSPVTGGFYFGEVLAGVVRTVTAAGGRVTLVQTLDAGRAAEQFSSAPNVLTPAGWASLDGFVAISWAATERYLRTLHATGKPLVLVSNDVQLDVTTVVVDNASGVRRAVEHLIEHGHHRIAFVGNLGQTDMVERYGAYSATVAEHELPHRHVMADDHVEAGGRSAAPGVLAAMADGFTAAVCTTDRVALGLMAALRESGRSVPEDLAIIGFDDVEAGWTAEPPLTTVTQDFTEQGAFAAELLLAELRGELTEHCRHTVPTTFVVRESCGCRKSTAQPDASGTEPRAAGAREAAQVLTDVLDHLALDRYEGRSHVALADLDVDALDDAIAAALDRLTVRRESPEIRRTFIETFVRLAARHSRELAVRGFEVGEIIQHCTITVCEGLMAGHMGAARRRIDRLIESLSQQYDVGLALLGELDSEPAELAWLDLVPASAGCLGLWEGPPSDGLLRIQGVYDPSGSIDHLRGELCRFEEFPPRAVTEVPRAQDAGGPESAEVAYVVPVRGPTGDHGLLCVVGPLDDEFGSGRATHNHWAALLGAALRERKLLESVRRSEERYAAAAEAARDGLWEYDFDTQELYLSDRCRDLLGGEVAVGTWLDRIHPDDRLRLRETIGSAAVAPGTAVEIEFRVAPPGSVARWLSIRALATTGDGAQSRRMVGSLSDIDGRKQLEEQLRQAALYDTLTGLPNRRLFLERLSWAIERSHRREDDGFAVVFLDLDGFKLINDSLGHLMGDELLEAVGNRLREGLRSVDTAARFGGDEFAVLLDGLQPEAVLAIVERIQERIAAPVLLGDHEVAVTASVGIALSETGYDSADDVLRDADIAMYHAKEAERGTASVFDPIMHLKATGRLRAQSELRTALAEEQFVVHYQPVVALDGTGLAQMEALVRWQHPDRGILLPAEFLPVMAETGTIVVLGQWLIDTVCAQIARWQLNYHGPVTVAVNLSHREFWSAQLLPTVTEAIARHHVAPECLILEITESVIMSDPDAARQIMADLHAIGIRMHIDDFGTGQSSLHALRAFPVDALKIDQSFIHQIDVDHQTTELVRIIVGMGHTLGLDVVAEGVETTAQADRLRAMGCATAQGWLFAAALPGDEAGRMLGRALSPWVPSQR